MPPSQEVCNVQGFMYAPQSSFRVIRRDNRSVFQIVQVTPLNKRLMNSPRPVFKNSDSTLRTSAPKTHTFSCLRSARKTQIREPNPLQKKKATPSSPSCIMVHQQSPARIGPNKKALPNPYHRQIHWLRQDASCACQPGSNSRDPHPPLR